MLYIVCVNIQHFEHIQHLYRIESDQAKAVTKSEQLRGLPREAIVIWGEEWWRHKPSEEIYKIEELVKIHNKRRK